MILKEATIKYKGYDPDELSYGSGKYVCCSCDKCGSVRWIEFKSYTNLCRLCSYTPEIKEKMKNNHADFKGENHPNYKGGKITLICQYCGKEYKKDICLKDISKFCSTKCQGLWRSIYNKGKNNPNWKGGISKQPYCNLWTESFREKIRNQYHRQCYFCNMNEKDNGRKLDVHHVNYNKNCLCGSSCEFVPLCIRCHMKTNFNRQYWEDLIMHYLYPERYFMINL